MAHADESQFEIKDKGGFFVIITQKTFHLRYCDKDWKENSLSVYYEEDEKRLTERFQLSGNNNNYKIGHDLTNDNEGEVGKQDEKIVERVAFKKFMKWVRTAIKKRKAKNKLAFVMIFLMSHGFEDGKFLLASQGNQYSANECCGGKHIFSGDCYARDLVEDVMKPVSEAAGVEVPKLFFVQTCRGDDAMAVHPGTADLMVKPDSKPASKTELFFPDYANTLVFRAGVEYQLTYVATGSSLNGSVFIQSFCEALDELQKACKEYEEVREKVKDCERLKKYLESPGCRENVTGGWIMSVCRHTSALAAKWMIEVTLIPKIRLENLFGDVKKLSPENKVNLKLVADRMKESLHADNPAANCDADVDEVFLWCQTRDQAVAVMNYFMTNVLDTVPTYSLQNIIADNRCQEIEQRLDRIIKAWQTKQLKQQPHVSSTLSKKLSLIEILRLQNASGTAIKDQKCVLL